MRRSPRACDEHPSRGRRNQRCTGCHRLRSAGSRPGTPRSRCKAQRRCRRCHPNTTSPRKRARGEHPSRDHTSRWCTGCRHRSSEACQTDNVRSRRTSRFRCTRSRPCTTSPWAPPVCYMCRSRYHTRRRGGTRHPLYIRRGCFPRTFPPGKCRSACTRCHPNMRSHLPSRGGSTPRCSRRTFPPSDTGPARDMSPGCRRCRCPRDRCRSACTRFRRYTRFRRSWRDSSTDHSRGCTPPEHGNRRSRRTPRGSCRCKFLRDTYRSGYRHSRPSMRFHPSSPGSSTFHSQDRKSRLRDTDRSPSTLRGLCRRTSPRRRCPIGYRRFRRSRPRRRASLGSSTAPWPGCRCRRRDTGRSPCT